MTPADLAPLRSPVLLFPLVLCLFPAVLPSSPFDPTPEGTRNRTSLRILFEQDTGMTATDLLPSPLRPVKKFVTQDSRTFEDRQSYKVHPKKTGSRALTLFRQSTPHAGAAGVDGSVRSCGPIPKGKVPEGRRVQGTKTGIHPKINAPAENMMRLVPSAGMNGSTELTRHSSHQTNSNIDAAKVRRQGGGRKSPQIMSSAVNALELMQTYDISGYENKLKKNRKQVQTPTFRVRKWAKATRTLRNSQYHNITEKRDSQNNSAEPPDDLLFYEHGARRKPCFSGFEIEAGHRIRNFDSLIVPPSLGKFAAASEHSSTADGMMRDRRAATIFDREGKTPRLVSRNLSTKSASAVNEALRRFVQEFREFSKRGTRKKATFRKGAVRDDTLQDEASEDHKEVGGVVSILGLFELSKWGSPRPEGAQELAAAQLAVSHINENQLLGHDTLKLVTNDTKCDPGVAVDAFFHALYTRREKMVMLLGSACSEVTESLAKVTPYWNMLQVSFGSVSAALSDRREFPLFYRTVAPDSSHNSARVAFVNRFNWKTVTALSQNEDVYSLGVNGLVTEMERANITCKATITFAETDFKDQLKRLRDLDTRIIIGSFSPNVGPKIFCEAYRLGMYGADYAWILQGRPENSWWRKRTGGGDCTTRELNQAIEGVILVASYDSTVGDTLASTSGLGRNELERLLGPSYDGRQVYGSQSYADQSYVRQSYDAVWAMALALNVTQRTMDITKFNYDQKDVVESLFRNMATLKFTGVSGPIAFNGPDRVGITAFYQVQSGEARTVGLYDATRRLLELPCAGCRSPFWEGGQVPIAERIFKLRIVTIEPAAFLTISCLASVGITLAITFLVFNLHFRKLKYIKLSSPKMNNMAVVGCILVYTAVILLGLDNATLRSDAFPIVCTARVYLLSAGFSMAFGSMFTKTYRVHRIFTRSSSSVVKNKMLQDTQLISLICVLLVVDGLIVTLWVTFDPMERHLRNLSLEISTSDRSVVYQPQVEECGSQYTHSWLGILYVYKGLLLIVGVYMAWETRHVKIPALNDSKYIGLSVYSAVITSVLVVVFANLISERATMAFLTITALILVSTTTSLCILFIPKIHAIMAHTDRSTTIDPIMQSMGLKIEYNTRRFVTDDRREVHYRVEVQNRVYKRDLLTLDNEISKLEKQLYSCTSDTSSRSSIAFKGDIEEGLDRLSVAGGCRGKSPSVSGGIPMLLLSVLPPVIPRASWPSAENCVQPQSRKLAFNSEPKLDQTKQFVYFPRGSRHQSIGCTEDKESSMFTKFLNVIAPKSTRKSSGIASALRAHMGYMAGIIPPTEGSGKSREDQEESGRSLSQPRVSFSVGDRTTTGSGSSVFKERPKGSPRFPHRIVPTSSLNDLDHNRRGTPAATGPPTPGDPDRRRDSKWRSLEDASLSPSSGRDVWLAVQVQPLPTEPEPR